ncbi:MAG: hypothetical protein LUF78_01625 [Clostridiales bacterium]|nr:hypothetical protein [Clostridiales bacterium]
MKLKVKIGGDVNIYLTPDAEPVSLDISEDDLDDADQEDRSHEGLSYFESAVNILKDMIETIGQEPDESEDADDNKIVMILTPGQEPKVATFAEADELIPGFCADYECVENFLDLGLNLYHRKNQVLRIGGNEFLIGTAVVCFEDANGDLWSLGGQDIYQVFRHMEKNHAVLSVDGKQIVALEITGTEPEEEGE